MKASLKLAGAVVAVVWMTGAARPALAQGLDPGQTEVFGFAGAVSDGGGTTFGGGVQFAVGPRLLVSAEGGYLTAGEDFSGFGVDVDFSGLTVDGTARYLFPGGSDRFTPYVLGGVGFLRASASSSVAGFSASASDSTIGVNVGGGARWQVGERWGVQPELKVFIADGSHVRVTAAAYFRF